MSDPLRVLLMAGSMEGGGSEYQTLLLLERLNRQRFAPELYLTYRRGALLNRVPSDVPIHAFDDEHPPARLWWPGREHRRRVRHLRRLIEDRRIDRIYERTFHMSLLAGPARRKQTPRVAVIVSPPEQDLPHSESRFLSFKKRSLARSYAQAEQVLAVSDAVRHSATEYYGLPATKIHTLHSPVDVRALQERSKFAPPWPMPEDRWQIACVGRMTREKGHDLLIAALTILPSLLGKEMPAMDLWMMGDGPLRANLQEQAAAVDGSHVKMHFPGYVQNPAAVVGRCDLLVSPSRYEGFPNAVLEAMALGIPVIATDVGGTRELFSRSNLTSLIPAENPLALAQSMANLFRDQRGAGAQSIALLAADAQAFIQQRFSLDRYMESIEQILAVSGKS